MTVGSTLVTGSSGHIGRHLAESLSTGGHPVRGVDLVAGPSTQYEGDLLGLDLDRLLDGCGAVVHCAARHAPHVRRASAAEFIAVNVTATARLLAAAGRSGVGRFVFLSTTSVYGHALEDLDQAVWVDEQLTPIPRDIYDHTKLEAESAVEAGHAAALQTVSLRIARCFPEPPRTTVVNRLSRGVDLRDVISAIERSLTAELPEHHILNVAGPRVLERGDCNQLRRGAAVVIARRLPWLAGHFAGRGWELPETIDRVYVSDRAAAVLGYGPAHDVASALTTVSGLDG